MVYSFVIAVIEDYAKSIFTLVNIFFKPLGCCVYTFLTTVES